MLLLPLRSSQVFAVTEELQVAQTPKNNAHKYEREAGHEQQTVGRLSSSIQVGRFAVAFGIHCYAASCRGVDTVFWHGEIRKKSAPPGSSFADCQLALEPGASKND
jgi:hypothetical protein